MTYIPIHWKIQELVSPEVYRIWGESAWGFFDDEYLMDLDLARDLWGDSLIINDWDWNNNQRTNYTQSGLRDNMCPIVKSKKRLYLSGHVLAKAFDIKPINRQYDKFWHFMWEHISQKRFKKIIRIEHFKHTIHKKYIHIDGLNFTGMPEIFTV